MPEYLPNEMRFTNQTTSLSCVADQIRTQLRKCHSENEQLKKLVNDLFSNLLIHLDHEDAGAGGQGAASPEALQNLLEELLDICFKMMNHGENEQKDLLNILGHYFPSNNTSRPETPSLP